MHPVHPAVQRTGGGRFGDAPGAAALLAPRCEASMSAGGRRQTVRLLPDLLVCNGSVAEDASISNACSQGIHCFLSRVAMRTAPSCSHRCIGVADRIFAKSGALPFHGIQRSRLSHSTLSGFGLNIASVPESVSSTVGHGNEAPQSQSSSGLFSISSTPDVQSVRYDTSKRKREQSESDSFSWTVLWDIENVPVPQSFNGVQVVRKLCAKLATMRGPEHNDPVRRIVAITNISTLRVTLRNELQSNGVSLHHVETKGRKEAADKALITELCMSSFDKLPPAGIALLSGDQDFAYSLARMRNMGYTTVVIAPQRRACSPFLTSVPDVVWSFKNDVLGEGTPEKGLGRSPRPPKRSNASPASAKNTKAQSAHRNSAIGADDNLLAEVRLLCEDLKLVLSADRVTKSVRHPDVRLSGVDSNPLRVRRELGASPISNASPEVVSSPPSHPVTPTEHPPQTARVLPFETAAPTENGEAKSSWYQSLPKFNCRLFGKSAFGLSLIFILSRSMFVSILSEFAVAADSFLTSQLPQSVFDRKVALYDIAKLLTVIVLLSTVVAACLISFRFIVNRKNSIVRSSGRQGNSSPRWKRRNRRVSTLTNPSNL